MSVVHKENGKDKVYHHGIFYAEDAAERLQSASAISFDSTFRVDNNPSKSNTRQICQLITARVMEDTAAGKKQFSYLYIVLTNRKKKDFQAVSKMVELYFCDSY